MTDIPAIEIILAKESRIKELEGEFASLRGSFADLNQRLTNAHSQIDDLVVIEAHLKSTILKAIDVLTVSRGAGARDYLLRKWILIAKEAVA